MSFLGNILNAIPVVGHVKGVVHYIAGDVEGGCEAMHSASRTSAVIGGAVGGTIVGGPVGGVAGALGAGNAVDGAFTMVESAVAGEWIPRGNFGGLTDIVTGDNVIGGISEIALNTVGDVLGGGGAEALMKGAAKGTIKEGGRAVLKQGLKKQAAQAAARLYIPAVLTKITVSEGFANSDNHITKTIREMKKEHRRRRRMKGRSSSSNRQEERDDKDKDDEEEEQDDESDEPTESEESSSSEEEISTDEESSEDQCRAIRSDGKQCNRGITTLGACNYKSHQRQVRNAVNGRPFQLNLDLSNLEKFIRTNLDYRIVRNIQRLTQGNLFENIGCIYVYTLENGNIKIGRTAQPDPETRWNQQRQYKEKIFPKTWMCRIHTLAETLIINILDFARINNSSGNKVEEFKGDFVDRSAVEKIIREVIKAIHKAMKKKDRDADNEEESSDIYSTHYPDH